MARGEKVQSRLYWKERKRVGSITVFLAVSDDSAFWLWGVINGYCLLCASS